MGATALQATARQCSTCVSETRHGTPSPVEHVHDARHACAGIERQLLQLLGQPSIKRDLDDRLHARIPAWLGAGFLLGSGGAGAEGGALARFVPERGERLRLITEAAHACAREAQTEEAVELFLYAGQPRPALHILNLQISELLEPALQDPALSAKPLLCTHRIQPLRTLDSSQTCPHLYALTWRSPPV